MPFLSDQQRKAMGAALHGHSNLGIPKEVAEKFFAHDMAPVLTPNAGIPAGVRRLARDAVEGLDMSEEDWRGLIDGLVKFFSEEKREPEHAMDQEPKTLYVHRKLRDGSALREWALQQGFKTTLPRDDMHVTIAFSKTPVDWSKLSPQKDVLRHDMPEGTGERTLEQLGAEGAVVLRFESPWLQERWQEFRDAGASWDHDAYRPHVTITYDAGDVDLSKVKPYDGVLEFDPEVFQEVKAGSVADAKKRLLGAEDVAMAMDRSFNPPADSRFEIAMDRDSVREKTRDGRLIVKRTHITKANVCPYRGKEIPGYEELGLDPTRVYNLLRAPEELQKAAPTLNGVQLLIIHKPVSAADHGPNETVGSLGTDAEFDGEYLDNSLYVNAQKAIDGIESKRQHELSAGYHYKPDMTPGNFRGSAYDGVMRDIVFNHVALVEDGRAGPDVMVADEALKENDMAKVTRFGARTLSIIAGAIAPQLAMDQSILISPKLLEGLTSKTYKANRDKLLNGVRLALDGGKKLRKGLALDATMKDLAKVVDAFPDDMESGMDEPAPEEANPAIEKMSSIEAPKGITEPGSTYDAEPLKGFLRDCGMDEEKIAKCMDMMPKNGLAGDESEEEKKKREKEAADKAAKDSEMDKDKVTKPAMDAALKAQSDTFQKELAKVRETERGIRVALDEVKPWVGEIPATMAFDSAADVHRHACVMKGVENAKNLHADALMPILKTMPRIGARQQNDSDPKPKLAMDAVDKAKKLAPGLEHISTTL